MEDYLFQKFNTVVWKTAKKKERKETKEGKKKKDKITNYPKNNK